MANGTVKSFFDGRGFGFIIPDDGGKEIIVHKSNLIDEITDGDKVSYDVEENEKGLNAINVKVI